MKALRYNLGNFNQLLNQYKKGARLRGYKFELTVDQFRELTKNNCYYCGSKPKTKYKHDKARPIAYIYNGIDRKNNDLGYNVENCVTCCKKCNYLKGTFSLREFKNQINKIYKFWNKL